MTVLIIRSLRKNTSGTCCIRYKTVQVKFHGGPEGMRGVKHVNIKVIDNYPYDVGVAG